MSNFLANSIIESSPLAYVLLFLSSMSFKIPSWTSTTAAFFWRNSVLFQSFQIFINSFQTDIDSSQTLIVHTDNNQDLWTVMMCFFPAVYIKSLIVNSIHEHFPVEMKHAVFSANWLKVIEVHLIIVKLSLCAINLLLIFHGGYYSHGS